MRIGMVRHQQASPRNKLSIVMVTQSSIQFSYQSPSVDYKWEMIKSPLSTAFTLSALTTHTVITGFVLTV